MNANGFYLYYMLYTIYYMLSYYILYTIILYMLSYYYISLYIKYINGQF